MMHKAMGLMLATQGTSGDAEVSMSFVDKYVIPVASAGAIMIGAWILAGWLGSKLERAMLRAKLDLTLARFLARLARWGIIILGVALSLSVFGVDPTTLAAAIGAMGIAIGLALQGTLSNFAAGVMLLIFRPFDIGDVVELDGDTGTVHTIDLFVTKIDTFDKKRVIVPNSKVFGNTIENITHHPFRRVTVSVGTAYEADLDAARAALEKAANGIEGRRDDPPAQVVLSELGSSSVEWSVRVWADTADFWPVRERLVGAIKRELDAADVGIPYPQMDVHVKEMVRASER